MRVHLPEREPCPRWSSRRWLALTWQQPLDVGPRACINQLTVEPHLDLLGALFAPRPRAQDEHDRQHGAPEASILPLL